MSKGELLMKTAAKVLYILGIVFNVAVLLAWAVFVILPVVGLNSEEILNQVASQLGLSIDAVKSALTFLTVGSGVGIVFAILALVLSIIAIKSLNDGKGKKSAHVLILVGGILAIDPFYIVAAIFGLVAAGQDAK